LCICEFCISASLHPCICAFARSAFMRVLHFIIYAFLYLCISARMHFCIFAFLHLLIPLMHTLETTKYYVTRILRQRLSRFRQPTAAACRRAMGLPTAAACRRAMGL
jgi:hypothetical protein